MFFILKKKEIIIAILTTFIFFCIFSFFLYDTRLFAKEEILSYPDENMQHSNFVTDDVENRIHSIYEQEEKIAYLTFDDGPTQKVTPKVLDILDELDIKANFFLVGKHVEELPELVKREFESGHFLANHGYSHNNNKLYTSKTAFLNEIIKTDLAISNAIGQNYKSHLFRFPNGSMSKNHHSDKMNAIKYLKEIDYTYIDWNCLNNDSMKKYSNSELINNLKTSCQNKNTLVILMHDTGDVNKTYDVLADSIQFLKQQGYEFHTFHDFF